MKNNKNFLKIPQGIHKRAMNQSQEVSMDARSALGF